ncbi:MAG: hypothetical protein ACD_11C00057G0007 [uncultured bacterium]|nr:MAG: hypothetical protein ACD_11C00057G0007 [uncultured bacterium]HBR71796.1 hypothetical protein [Candidatus Moranbacteria bacterium]
MLEPTEEAKKELLNFYNASFPKSQWDFEKISSFFDKENKGICFVIKSSSKLFGFSMGKLYKNRKDIFVLSSLFVSSELRGNGYAKKLIEIFSQEAFFDKNIKKIILHFRDSNNLQNFYEKVGFINHCIDGEYKNREKKHYMEMLK